MTDKKVVLITGTSSGIGKAIAAKLLSAGHNVYGLSRSRPELGEWVQADIRDSDRVKVEVDRIFKKEGQIDVLVNNAGISLISPFEATSSAEIEELFSTNLIGAMKITNALLPEMRRRKEGLIIGISSLGGMMGLPYQSIYCAGKFAMEGWMESLQMEVAQFGIKCVLIEPGDCKTEITARRKVGDIKLIPDEYRPTFSRTQEKVENEEKNGFISEKIAKLVLKVISANKPKFRYKIGKTSQIFAPTLRSILPGRWFLRLVSRYYFD